MLIDNGIDISGLKISSTSHVTMPYHRILDEAMEADRGSNKIGTTGRGIGPTYADKSQRNGIRIRDLLNNCLLYTSPSPRDREKSRMPSSA